MSAGADYPVLRVKALQRARRRGGLDFTSEPRSFTPVEFVALCGSGLGAAIALAAILQDPLLATSLVVDGEERGIEPEEHEALIDLIGAESARVDPAAPPTDDAEKAKADEEAAAAAEKAKAPAKAKAKA